MSGTHLLKCSKSIVAERKQSLQVFNSHVSWGLCELTLLALFFHLYKI